MKQKDKYKIALIIIFLLISNIFIIYNVFYILKNIEGKEEDIIYIGKSNSSILYNVFLHDNSYLDESVICDNRSYITSLTNYINLKFNYEYNFDRDLNLEYNYLIRSTIIGSYSGGNNVSNPVLNKTYLLKPQTTLNVKSNITISEEFNLTLDKYNNFVRNFITDLELPINSLLKIELVINYKTTVGNKSISKEHIMSISLPLNVSAFDIEADNNFPDEETVYLNPMIKKEINFAKAIVYIGFDIILTSLCIFLIKKTLEKHRSKYLLEKEKILKHFDDKIVEVANFINYKKWETIDIKDFDELINLADETFEPIFFWERKHNRNRESWFCILRDGVLYRYILYKKKIHVEDRN